jgi:hypothetical protein
MTMNALNIVPAITPCVCGWNTPDHNGDQYSERTCPAVKAATRQLFEQGFTTTKMTRWSNYYVDPDDVAVIVLRAVQAQQSEYLAEQAEAFDPEQPLADVIPIRPGMITVKTSGAPISLDPHDAYYRAPFTGRAA